MTNPDIWAGEDEEKPPEFTEKNSRRWADDTPTALGYMHSALAEYTDILTPAQITYWSGVTGIPCQHMIYILQGDATPTEDHRERLLRIFTPETLDQLATQGPESHWEFVELPDNYLEIYDEKKSYPIEELYENCLVAIDGDGWLKISGIEVSRDALTIYSGGVRVGDLRTGSAVHSLIPRAGKMESRIKKDRQAMEKLTDEQAIQARRAMMDRLVADAFRGLDVGAE